MRFRPSGGFQQNQKPDRSAIQARADATSEKAPDSVYERARHEQEIDRAENIAAGLPAETPASPEAVPAAEGEEPRKKGAFRKPHLDTPPEVAEEKFEPVPLRTSARRPGREHQIRRHQGHSQSPADDQAGHQAFQKDLIINAESLEMRVALVEHGRLEELTIERTTEERLVGSIFKGKVRNLEDGLKAAFVDIGFEKNAFLHYWDIVPTNFDSGVEVVEREGKRRDRPRITQRDIPRLYPPGSEIIVQVTKGPIGTKGPRVTTNIVLPGRYLVLLPNSDQSGISRKIENPEERQRLKAILREINIPDGMGVIMRTAGEGQQKRYFILDLAILLEQWNEIQQKIKSQPPASCVFQEPDLIERTVRDFLTDDVDRVVVDNAAACERMRAMIGRISTRRRQKSHPLHGTSADFRPASTSRASWRTPSPARSI